MGHAYEAFCLCKMEYTGNTMGYSVCSGIWCSTPWGVKSAKRFGAIGTVEELYSKNVRRIF